MLSKIFSFMFLVCLFFQSHMAEASNSCAPYHPVSGLEEFATAEQYFTGSKQEKPNYKNAYYAFKEAAAKGHATAHLRLGHIYAEKHFANTPYDLKKAEEHFQIAAKHNAGDALFRMGNFYLQYLNPPQIDHAIFWLSKAADCDHATAQFDLARLYTKHRAKNKKDEILYLLGKAAENNNRQAQEMLARFYLKGKEHITAPDPDKMAYWAEKLTISRSAPVFWIETLANYYESKGNTGKARILWQRAAQKGSVKAKQHLNAQQKD